MGGENPSSPTCLVDSGLKAGEEEENGLRRRGRNGMSGSRIRPDQAAGDENEKVKAGEK